jgi:hypothetical protein
MNTEEIVNKVSLSVGGPHSTQMFTADEVINLIEDVCKELEIQRRNNEPSP